MCGIPLPNMQFRDEFRMSAAVSGQGLTETNTFFFQFDASTDLRSCFQLLVFVIYIHLDDNKEEFLVCRALEITTKGDIMDLCGVCTDRTLMLG